jgi:hypothetical protein
MADLVKVPRYTKKYTTYEALYSTRLQESDRSWGSTRIPIGILGLEALWSRAISAMRFKTNGSDLPMARLSLGKLDCG